MLGDVSCDTATNGPTVQKDVLFAHFQNLIHEIIYSEGVLLKTFGVFRLIAMQAVTWIFHGQNAHSKAFFKAIKHIVAHSKVICVRMEVQHNLARSIFMGIIRIIIVSSRYTF